MTAETPPPDAPLLCNLRARQFASRTAQVARTLEEPAPSQGGAFNATAAAALNTWKRS
ncbi:hypothetical protein [Sphingomonas sp. NPDC079357]|uniref:hypothetical protein n=1 Tax=Sphingomonas sp. NPDC079357 TaxID=3364518 RepID=UPI00384E5E19